jgi:type IV pilus assembly protein PilY1
MQKGISMNLRYLKYVLVGATLALSVPTQAEDIDIYTGAPTSPPNVLIIVDNTANWNTAFENEMIALSNTISALPENKFRIGFLFANETGSPNNNTTGGYVRAAIRLMDSTNKARYQALVQNFGKLADKGNGGVSSLVLAEAYLYLAGKAPYAGNFKVKTDFTGNASGTAADQAVYALAGNALGAFDGTQYNSPMLSGCQKNVIIYISNGASNDNSTVVSQSETMLTTAGGDKTVIPLSPNGSQGNPMDEWALFMKNSLGVTTFTIDVDKVTTGQGPGWSALLQSMATVSEGQYFDVSSANPAAMTEAMAQIFSNIQAVDSAFASVALPQSAEGEGSYLNQVFISMFRPDKTGAPRWAGNLKQYKFGYDATGNLGLLDADGTNAISSEGFIAECARSYWTPATPDSYWAFKPQGGCSTVMNSDKSNSPDGEIVEKGAQAYKLRSSTSRTVKTCLAAACTELKDFNSTNVSQTDLGAATVAERDALISWAKGLDVDDENKNADTTPVETRPSVHGDVVHSVPLPINYGTDDAPNVVVYYGGNDGMLRAVNGNRDGGATIGGLAPGMEVWSFMAPEFYPNIKRLRANTPPVSFFGATFMTDPAPKPYGFDGPITAYRDADDVWLYASMRRGGRAIYAFDVTDPASSALKWKHDATSMGDLGQTWSTPVVMRAAGHEAGAAPMLIMGGGYDTCEDADPHVCGTSTTGNKIYVLDAEEGTLLKALDTDRAVIAEVFVVPDSTGLARFAYAVDLGGNVYRINIGAAEPSGWSITKIASLGCAAPGTCSPNRKFMFAPSIVESGGKYMLMLGSGDREKPLMGYTAAASVSNYFFMLKDDPYDPEWLKSESTNCGGTEVICLNSLYPIGVNDTSPTMATVDEKKGWYLSLNPHEQVVSSALTIFGTVYFNTHVPAVASGNSCDTTLGRAFTYKVYYANAAANTGIEGSRAEEVAGGGLLGSPIGGLVTLDNGETVPFVTKGIDPEDPVAPNVVYQPKSRVYWHIQP